MYRPLHIVSVLLLLTVLVRLPVQMHAANAQETQSAAPAAERPSLSYSVAAASTASASAGEPILIDHTSTDLSQIPPYWIEQAKALLRVAYAHTSHGSQPITGMRILESDPLYSFVSGCTIRPGELSLCEISDDLGNGEDTSWANDTRDLLSSSWSDRNVVIWAWCGGVEGATVQEINTYLTTMSQLEADYPGVTFVYMTGHLDGTGIEGNLNQRNEQIRAYCAANNKVLYDFADIESYDPDGENFLVQGANDGCYYDSNGDGVTNDSDANWADEWCNAHPGDPLCASCTCAHSRPLNCNLKARAFWWMMARIAGWPGPGEEEGIFVHSAGSPSAVAQGQRVTYTITVRSSPAPVDLTAEMSTTVPPDLAYVSGSLTASSGATTDASAPALGWSGTLSPSATAIITYAATVLPADTQAVTTEATVTVEGYDPFQVSATVIANGYSFYLPCALRGDP